MELNLLPKSIRWRLPLSYAAIALLTTASLGIVLLAIILDRLSQAWSQTQRKALGLD